MAAKGNADISELPWPECLGFFDEESCRFFLRELGQKIVQNYPFAVGMEEVYAQIVDEYGLEGAADAISVLQELLEDDNAAAGVGDDGDIWRSWRYSWRHRNDNPLNPYIPRARGRILGPPTATRIRLLKCSNFVQQELMRTGHTLHPHQQYKEIPLKSHIYQKTSLKNVSTPGSLLRVRGGDGHSLYLNWASPSSKSPDGASNSGKSDRKIGTNSVDSIIDNPSGLAFCTTNRQTTGGLAEGSNTQFTKYYEVDDASPSSPRRSMPDPSRAQPLHDKSTHPKRKSYITTQVSNGIEVSPTICQGVVVPDLGRIERSHNPESAATSLSPVSKLDIRPTENSNDKIPLSSRLLKTQENRLSLPSEICTAEVEASPCKTRALHRQARMIDGKLFHTNTRKGRALENEINMNVSPVKVGDHTANRLGSQSTQSASGLRTSWLHNVLTRFRKHNNSKQNLHTPKRQSNLAEYTMSSGSNSKNTIGRHRAATDSNGRLESALKPSQNAAFGFDGVSEHQNKPLPLSPADKTRKPFANQTRRFRFDEEFENNIVPLEQITVAYREQPESASLVSATMTGPHELSPQEKHWKYGSASTSPNGPSSPSSFSTIACRNPYDDWTTTSTPDLSVPSPLSFYKQEVSSAEWPFRSGFDSTATSCQAEPHMGATVLPIYFNEHASTQNCSYSSVDQQRGRRPESPSNALKEKPSLSPSKKPRARSRSPVKRLIGMVKSSSTNQIPTDCPHANLDTPPTGNKKKWKELSHKLRHGFLTADLEQLEQEEMIQQYMSSNANVDAVRITTPPSNGDRVAFPVSLKSAGQNILWSELEFALIETANTFLKRELEAGRLTRESILQIKHQWLAKNRPQVVEFYYDHATQSELIIANLRSIQLYSDYCEDAVMLNSVLHQWKVLTRELSVKTLCMPDSIVRRWVHDGRRVLELLGASYECLFKFDKISTLCVSVINSHEKEKARQRKTSHDTGAHRRSASDGSQKSSHVHEAALMALRPFGNYEEHPPLPTPTSTGPNLRKLTPQERMLVESLKRKQHNYRPFQSHAQSASLSGIRQRG